MIYSDTPTHGWVVGWVSGSMGGVKVKSPTIINLDLMEIIQFCLKISAPAPTPCSGWPLGNPGATNTSEFEYLDLTINWVDDL